MILNKEISYSEFATDWYIDYMKSSINPNSTQSLLLSQAFPQNTGADAIRQNIVSFNVFFSDLTYNSISDVPQTNWFGLLTNMAGICGGSFLGMSLLAIFEFFEYIILSFLIIIRHFLFKINLFKLKKYTLK